MASSLAVKRFLSSGLLSMYLRPVAFSACRRSFNTSATCLDDESSDDDRYVTSDDDHYVYPHIPRAVSPGSRPPCEQRKTKDSLILLLDMPGLVKEDVKVSVGQNNTLIIKGEGGKESLGDVRRFSSKIDLHRKSLRYNIDQIKAEMKNGVLKVTVPKIKKEERKAMINVKVE